MTAQWSELHRRAKALEARLEGKVQKYASLAQKINADFLCDEENPLLENREEQELGNDIERDLHELAECIDGMRHCTRSSVGGADGGMSEHRQDVLIKRYQEIHFDYSTEFKNTSTAVTRKRESMELFQSSKKLHAEEHDSSVAKLLRERSSIAASLRSVNDIISEAWETRSSLSSQRSGLMGASGGLSGLSARVPTFNSLIDNIQRKKYRESMVIVLTVSMILCFFIW
eukprot:CAMPEP_0114427732 /NCGR_PEP_ID=MMETSP0103-20121206/8522_1 /TAXON_ID=37642 ORGANISM="Paraphysomonas imperforata, Strain PA2" /NCGR_SAMPLE_ID=MMETSP0103 /ASSEMBLY_ACC=CAM_ASM_000201 /LENGTH=228 /DNA_ID=CAMNT_0001596847 /DNA_START=83 /DNA_END=766 /DNA_ORIENTATION=+